MEKLIQGQNLNEKEAERLPKELLNLELTTRKEFESSLELFIQQLEDQIDALEGRKPSEVRDALLASLPKEINEYSAIACESSADFYMETRSLAGVKKPYTPLSTSIAVKEKDVAKIIRYHAGGLFFEDHQTFKDNLVASLERVIRVSDREVWIENARKDPAKPQYARIPTSNCCPFCLMIASRGFMRRRKKGDIKKAHNYCRCRIVVAFNKESIAMLAESGIYDPDYYREIYDNVGGDLTDLRKILNKCRKQYPEGVTPSGYVFTHPSRKLIKKLPLETPQITKEQKELLVHSLVANGAITGDDEALKNIKEYEPWNAFKLALHGHKMRWIDKNKGSSPDFIWESLDGLAYDFKERKNLKMGNPQQAGYFIAKTLRDKVSKPLTIQDRFIYHLSKVKKLEEPFREEIRKLKDNPKIKSVWIMYANKLEKIF